MQQCAENLPVSALPVNTLPNLKVQFNLGIGPKRNRVITLDRLPNELQGHLHLLEQRVQRDPARRRRVCFEFSHATGQQMIGARVVLARQMIITDGQLNQALEEKSGFSSNVHPDVFERIVCFEEGFIIELANALDKPLPSQIIHHR